MGCAREEDGSDTTPCQALDPLEDRERDPGISLVLHPEGPVGCGQRMECITQRSCYCHVPLMGSIRDIAISLRGSSAVRCSRKLNITPRKP